MKTLDEVYAEQISPEGEDEKCGKILAYIRGSVCHEPDSWDLADDLLMEAWIKVREQGIREDKTPEKELFLAAQSVVVGYYRKLKGREGTTRKGREALEAEHKEEIREKTVGEYTRSEVFLPKRSKE